MNFMQSKVFWALGLSFSLGLSSLHAQTVFTVGKEAVSKSEFLSWYQKNNTQNLKYDKASLESFANLYGLYKMKVMEANALKLDTIPELKSDIEMYRAQLAKNYTANKNALDIYIKEAYDHMLQERKVAHIMLSGYGEAVEQLNMAKLDSLANLINAGKLSFESAAQQFSTDKATAAVGGSLGYINALQTPYEFEKIAYSTPVGKVSAPFKSPYGYHIVKVIAERPSSGTYEVAQILLTTVGLDQKAIEEQQKIASTILAKLKSGASFEQMVKEYSDDVYSKDKNGVIKPITTGSVEEAIESAVFALKKPGDLSEPVMSNYGVHIFKLIKKTPLGSFEDEKPNLAAKVERSRSEAIKQEHLKTVKQEIGFKENAAALTDLINTVDQNDFNRDSKLGDYPQLKATMFEIGTQKYTQQDFLKYVHNLTQGKLNGRKEEAFKELYRVYTEKTVNDAQLTRLEKTNNDFKKLAEEYRNGVLIFDMMDKNIWSKANKDTAGLRLYYETNASKYKWNPGFAGVVFQSKNHKALQQIMEGLKSGATVQEALAKVNTPETDEKIYQQTGRFDFEHVAKVDKQLIKPFVAVGIYPDNKEGEVVIYADEVYYEPKPKNFAEARELVVDDYQKELERKWDSSLRAKYPMKINTAVLNSMVK
jgi:peptidyl-prolyl cis-trans isomerase SurA